MSWCAAVSRGLRREVKTFDAVPDAWAGDMLVHASPQIAAAEPAKPALAPRGGRDPAGLGRGGAGMGGAAPPRRTWRCPHHWRPAGRRMPASATCRSAASPLAERDAPASVSGAASWCTALLQHLPALPAADREAAAASFLARPGNGVPGNEAETLAAEVLAVLDHPELAPLFGPQGRAEVPLTGVVGGVVIGGLVDRLAVLPDRVLIADYKTNRAPPRDVADTPVLYLRQMAAYRAVLRAIFPGRDVHCALVWTTGRG